LYIHDNSKQRLTSSVAFLYDSCFSIEIQLSNENNNILIYHAGFQPAMYVVYETED